MKIKYFSIFLFLLLLVCCGTTVYAASDNSFMELDQSDGLSINEDGLSINSDGLLIDDDSLSKFKDEKILNDGDSLSTASNDSNGESSDASASLADNSSSDTPVNSTVSVNSSGNVSDASVSVNSSGNVSDASKSMLGNSSLRLSKASTIPYFSTNKTLSPYQKFNKDLENHEKIIYLTGNLKFIKPFEIRYDVVIDGQGHTINAQKKTYLFKISNSKVTIRNLILKNGKSDNGGAIFSTKSTLTIENCTFSNNKATNKGGAIYVYSGKLNVDKSTFKSNIAASTGGAIFTSSSKLTVKKSKFTSNKVENSKSSGHGGAITNSEGSSAISSSSFKTNYCLSKSLKNHNKATKYQFTGGAVYYYLGSNHTLTGCTFTSNKASNHGGALVSTKSKYVKINKCNFNGNKAAYEDGGAISFTGQKLVMTNSNFTKNHAYEDGGVMDSFSINKKNVQVTITGCLFKSNSAYKGGGTIWMGKKTVYTMKNNKFINNMAGMGGALFSEQGTVKINNCLFQGNQAKKVASWTVKTKGGKVLKHCGGALMIQNKNVQITKCTFKKNHATYGGVIFHSGGKLKMTANKFSGNTAKSGPKIKKG